MFILKEFQEKAVKSLLEHTFDALSELQPQTKILLEAPTGSGKTVMMASLIERIVEELPMQSGLTDNVAFIWFAPNTLHIQSFQSRVFSPFIRIFFLPTRFSLPSLYLSTVVECISHIRSYQTLMTS